METRGYIDDSPDTDESSTYYADYCTNMWRYSTEVQTIV